jgi:hypothetical protein
MDVSLAQRDASRGPTRIPLLPAARTGRALRTPDARFGDRVVFTVFLFFVFFFSCSVFAHWHIF